MVGLATVSAGGCTRDPIATQCPDVATGDLVISEIRGEQQSTDLLGQWVEVFNATTDTVDLRGLVLRVRKLDGSGQVDIKIRRSLPIAAGAYVVLGQFSDDDGVRPAYVDYGFIGDFPASWYAAGAVSILACGDELDRVVYDALPDDGTYAFGTTPPTAPGNDTDAGWCADTTNVNAGSPGEANRSCI